MENCLSYRRLIVDLTDIMDQRKHFPLLGGEVNFIVSWILVDYIYIRPGPKIY